MLEMNRAHQLVSTRRHRVHAAQPAHSRLGLARRWSCQNEQVEEFCPAVSDEGLMPEATSELVRTSAHFLLCGTSARNPRERVKAKDGWQNRGRSDRPLG